MITCDASYKHYLTIYLSDIAEFCSRYQDLIYPEDDSTRVSLMLDVINVRQVVFILSGFMLLP